MFYSKLQAKSYGQGKIHDLESDDNSIKGSCSLNIALVTNLDRTKITESAGACSISVYNSPSHPPCISRIADPALLKSRFSHFMEAMILESLDVDYVDEIEEMAIFQRGTFH
ncbi:hypothetical protein QQ045_001616 [Rhodiola kirilowii]